MSDPLHTALVAIFEAIADREAKSVQQVVEEFFSGYVEGATAERASGEPL